MNAFSASYSYLHCLYDSCLRKATDNIQKRRYFKGCKNNEIGKFTRLYECSEIIHWRAETIIFCWWQMVVSKEELYIYNLKKKTY